MVVGWVKSAEPDNDYASAPWRRRPGFMEQMPQAHPPNWKSPAAGARATAPVATASSVAQTSAQVGLGTRWSDFGL